MTVEATNEAKFGTANKKSVEFYTNGKKQAVLDTNGKIKLLRYVNGDMPDDWGNLPLYINKRGEITINAKGIGGGVQSEGELGCGSCIQPAPPCQVSLTGNGYSGSVPCLSSFAQSWREGGNRLDTSECSSSSNIIGTCNRFDFVMKANDTSAIFLKTDGRVNIGVDNDVLNNATTSAQLDISGKSINPNTGQRDHLRIYGDNDGNIESTTGMNLYFEGADNDFRINRGNV
ncbi:MAG: hypothetical protein KF900_13825, partial [Bacteroidetes bacterium]|nr:hypothetical protein [Bacteroidota bacterium]